MNIRLVPNEPEIDFELFSMDSKRVMKSLRYREFRGSTLMNSWEIISQRRSIPRDACGPADKSIISHNIIMILYMFEALYLDLFSIHRSLEGHVIDALAHSTHGGAHKNTISQSKEVVCLSNAKIPQQDDLVLGCVQRHI